MRPRDLDGALRLIVNWLNRFWTQNSTMSWPEVVRSASAVGIPGWTDHATGTLLRLLAREGDPPDAAALMARAESAVADSVASLPPNGVRFGPADHLLTYSEMFPVSGQLATDSTDQFLIDAAEEAAHPATVWVPRGGDGQDGAEFDEAVALPGATKELQARFRPPLLAVAGQPVDAVAADLRFSFRLCRFVNRRTGERIAIAGGHFAVMRPFRVDVAVRTVSCHKIVRRAHLSLGVEMKAWSNGISQAEVYWSFGCEFDCGQDSVVRRATGKITIGCPECRVLGVAGSTRRCFQLGEIG